MRLYSSSLVAALRGDASDSAASGPECTADRGTPPDPSPSTSPSSLVLGIYLATIFLGAGVFSLPIEARSIGLVALLILFSCVWCASKRMYLRVATCLTRPDHDKDGGGGEALGRAVVAAGGGIAGTALAWTGVAVYVVFASISYATLAVAALEALARELVDRDATLVLAGLFVGLLLIDRRLPRTSQVARRLVRLAALWTVGVATMVFVDAYAPDAALNGSVPALIALATFALGSIALTRSSAAGDHADQREDAAPAATGNGHARADEKLKTEHRAPVVGLHIQIGLMIVMAVTALMVAFDDLTWSSLTAALTPQPDARVTDALGALGVVVFALTATGLINLAGYRGMARPEFRRQVVSRSLTVVAAVLAGWATFVVLVVGHDGLQAMDQADTNSAAGLADQLAASGDPGGSVLIVVGALATLIAVTSANAGFIASLARESIGAVAEIRPSLTSRMPGERVLTCTLIVVGIAGATASVVGGSSPSSLLKIGGIAGGGTIVFILPLLAEVRPGKRVGAAVLAGSTAIAIGIWGTVVALDEEAVAIAVCGAVVAWMPVVPALLAARGVARSAMPTSTSSTSAPLPYPRRTS